VTAQHWTDYLSNTIVILNFLYFTKEDTYRHVCTNVYKHTVQIGSSSITSDFQPGGVWFKF